MDNPYWGAVRTSVHERNDWPGWHGRQVGGTNLDSWFGERHRLVNDYAFTISDPDTVAFVVKHAGPRVVDPMAGSGYWAYLLNQSRVDTLAFDRHPLKTPAYLVAQADAVDTARANSDRTLLLSWPPYNDTIGAKTLAAYRGERVIYMGEMEGGCCGTNRLFSLFKRDYRRIAEHVPVQWFGIHDEVVVYERRSVISWPQGKGRVK